MWIAVNPAIDQDGKKQRSHYNPEGNNEQRGKDSEEARCQNDSARNLQHRAPQRATVARFLLAFALLFSLFALAHKPQAVAEPVPERIPVEESNRGKKNDY